MEYENRTGEKEASTCTFNSFKLRAKVPGGCRLTFEEIAHDVEWRKPSSEENIVRSSYWLFLFKLRWVRRIWNFISNSFWKENCWYLSRHRLQLLWSLIFTQTLSYRKQIFEIWSGNQQRPFKFETTKKVRSSGFVR